MKKEYYTKLKYLPVMFLILFLTVAACVCNIPQVTDYDIKIIKIVQKLFTPEFLDFFAQVSCFCYTYSKWIIFLALLLLIKKKDFGIAIMYVFCCFSSYELTVFVKEIFQRIRPPFKLQIIEHPEDFSFPSGHSIDIMILLGLFIYIICKHVENKIIKYTISFICGLIIILVGLSRLVLGVHYPTDVLAGFLFGLTLISCIWLCDRNVT